MAEMFHVQWSSCKNKQESKLYKQFDKLTITFIGKSFFKLLIDDLELEIWDCDHPYLGEVNIIGSANTIIIPNKILPEIKPSTPVNFNMVLRLKGYKTYRVRCTICLKDNDDKISLTLDLKQGDTICFS